MRSSLQRTRSTRQSAQRPAQQPGAKKIRIKRLIYKRALANIWASSVLAAGEFAAGSTAAMYLAVVVFSKGASNMMRAKIQFGVVLACSVFFLAGLSASAEDKKDKDKLALSGVWTLKEG